MAYNVQNITFNQPVANADDGYAMSPSGFPYGKNLVVADIPNVAPITWHPGQIIDLEGIATLDQIEQSRHLKVHIAEGRMLKL